MNKRNATPALAFLLTIFVSAGDASAYEKIPSAIDRESVVGTYEVVSKLLCHSEVEAARRVQPDTKREPPCLRSLPSGPAPSAGPLPPSGETAKSYCGFSSLIMEKAACCGSNSAAMRPISGISMGGARTVAPIFFARFTEPSQSLTEK